jgi:hypothetical protein
MKKLLSITFHGERWPSGMGRRGWHRFAGFAQAFIKGEDRPRYFTEGHCTNSIVAALKAEGVDTAEFERGLDHWVKTGERFTVTP